MPVAVASDGRYAMLVNAGGDGGGIEHQASYMFHPGLLLLVVRCSLPTMYMQREHGQHGAQCSTASAAAYLLGIVGKMCSFASGLLVDTNMQYRHRVTGCVPIHTTRGAFASSSLSLWCSGRPCCMAVRVDS
jgi:hypothetical protein